MIIPNLSHITLLLLVLSISLSGIIIMKKIKGKYYVRGSSIDERILLFITCLYALSTGKPSREILIKKVSKLDEYGDLAMIFKRVYTLGKELGYGFPEALEIVSKEVKNPVFRDFLLRFSKVLALGQDLKNFLFMEQNIMLSDYEAIYLRALEAAKIMLGVYSTFMSTFTFLMINVVFILMIMGGNPSIIPLVALILGGALGVLVLVNCLLIPRGKIIYYSRVGPRLLRIHRLCSLAIIPTAIFIFIKMNVVDCDVFIGSLVTGALLLVPGIIAKVMENRISNIDKFFPIFIRTLGSHLSIVQDVSYAIRTLSMSEKGLFKKLCQRLYTRIAIGINPSVAWNLFISETGSELFRKGIRILISALEHGGNPEKVGNVLSLVAMKLLELRKRKQQVLKGFEATIYILHAVGIAIMVLIEALLQMFISLLGNIKTLLPLMNIPPGVLSFSFMIASYVLVLVNGLALSLPRDDSTYNIPYYIGILLIMTGVVWKVTCLTFGNIFRGSIAMLQLP